MTLDEHTPPEVLSHTHENVAKQILSWCGPRGVIRIHLFDARVPRRQKRPASSRILGKLEKASMKHNVFRFGVPLVGLEVDDATTTSRPSP